MKKKYPYYEILCSSPHTLWEWSIHLTHCTSLECNWRYDTDKSAEKAAKKWFNKLFPMGGLYGEKEKID